MKGNILQGTARGRLGNVVARVVHGKQIYANYQPNVTNPDSPLQREQRSIFKGINDSYKELRDQQRIEGYDFLYNLYSGASKTFRGIFFDFAQQAQRIGIDGDNNREIRLISPLMVNSTTGNYLPAKAGFEVDYGLFPFLGVDIYSPGTAYFGSNVPLDTKSRVIIIGSDTEAPNYKIHNNTGLDLTLTKVDRSANIGLPKSNGFKATAVECGEWNYIYSVDGSSIMEGAKGLNYDGTDYGFYLYYFWVDIKGRIIYAGNLKTFGAIPTPTP